jgi:hypothetical protein
MDAYLAKDQLVDEPQPASRRKRRKKGEQREHESAPTDDQQGQEARYEEAQNRDDRQNTKSSERESALHSARHFCSSADEWREVARLRTPELQQWIEQKAFEDYKEIASSLVSAIHYTVAQISDKLSRGNGYVAKEIQSDLSLANAIHMEGSSLFKFINNRMRIMLLLGIDVYQGKKQQRLDGAGTPTTATVEEEKTAAAQGPAE